MLRRQITFFPSMTEINQQARPENPNKTSDCAHALPEGKAPQQHANPGGVPAEHRLLTTAEAAAWFQVTERTVEAWRAKGLLSHRRVGRTIRFKFSDLLEALDTKLKVSRRP